MKRTRFVLSCLFAFLLQGVLVPSPSLAQWTADGIMLQARGPGARCSLIPDDEGGVWVVYETSGDIIFVDVYVQHFDADGYARFEGNGICVLSDSLSPTGQLLGAFARPDGGVVVAFTNGTVLPEYEWIVMGQAVSEEGERLFGPSGAVVSADRDTQWRRRFPSAVSDENGGFWALYEHPGADSMFITGMNADGTPKLEEDYSFEEHEGFEPALCSDGMGGIYIAWGNYLPDTNNVVQIELQHVLSDGSLGYEEPFILLTNPEGGLDEPVDLVRRYDNNDTYLSIKKGTGSIFQRITSEGVLPWGIEGVLINTPYGSLRPSNPVITPDGGVMVFSNRNHEAVLLRATPEGEPYFEGGYVLYEIIDLITIPSPLLISSPADSTYMCFNQLQIDLFTKRFVGFKFNDEGNNVWETTPHIFQEYGIYNGIEAFYGTLASDGSAILCIQWDRELTGTRLHLHKILPNGQLLSLIHI